MHNILFRYLCSSTCFGHFCAHPQEDLCIFTTSGSMSVSFGDCAVGRLVRDGSPSLTFLACECGNEPSGSIKCGEFLD